MNCNVAIQYTNPHGCDPQVENHCHRCSREQEAGLLLSSLEFVESAPQEWVGITDIQFPREFLLPSPAVSESQALPMRTLDFRVVPKSPQKSLRE